MSVPNIRFKEFNGIWRYYALGQISSIKTGNKDTQNKNEDGRYPFFVRSDNVERINSYSFDGEAILTSGDGVGVGKNFHYINGKFDFHQRVYSITAFKNGHQGMFVYHQFRHKFYNHVKRLSAKNSVDSVRMDMISEMKLAFPPIAEQQKIADFLTSVDDKINLLKKKKELLEQYKKGVMQKIFSQELRFKDKDGKDFPEWEEYKLKDILNEHGCKNVGSQVKEVFSVAKNKGVINQIEHLGRSFAATNVSHYKVLKPHDVVYTKSPTSNFPFGIIKQNKTGRTGIVSPLYGVFTPQTPQLGFILDYYFSVWQNTFNYLNPLVQKGAKNTMNIHNDTFLYGSELSLPTSPHEQQKIADFLTALDDKIALVERQIDKTEFWKKGLLQQMFV